MNVPEFQAKWRDVTLKERSAAQEHFLDLCHLLGQPTPAQADAHGAWYTFEKGAQKTTGGQGFADVWMRGYFAWEYKGNRADLKAAYQQLLQYSEALENPPLLVVSDFQRFEIHTRFTGMEKRVYSISLEDLDQPDQLAILRWVFTDPERLRPERTVDAVTEEAAARFGALAIRMRERGIEPHRAAHFLVQVLFCLFAEDVGLLPNRVFSRLLRFASRHAERFTHDVQELFEAMRDGGFAGYEEIVRFNGGLFAEIDAVPLTADELQMLSKASELDWTNIEPAIIGTLFERSLDPAKRSQLGAHYTSRTDIERVVEPVVMTPLRRRWDKVRTEADALKAAWDAATTPITRNNRRQAFASALFAFQEELAAVRILDPACGSGNFLYVALTKLKELEKEVVAYGSANGLPAMLPRVSPTQLYGLEVNEYARELAQTVIWIGYLQWMTANGFQVSRDPVLEASETIRLQDALLDLRDPQNPKEADWPVADYIIGNPPFLGGNRVRQGLGDSYLAEIWGVYENRVPRFADLVCYFFERARTAIEHGGTKRVGLLATNSVRHGVNRIVLDRIKQTGDIFMAWADEPWVLDGAAVRISIVCFDDGTETNRHLDGQTVTVINADLTGSIDLTAVETLPQNLGISFQGDIKGGPFEITNEVARELLAAPTNPNGRPNKDVVVPWINAVDLTQRSKGMWIIDFGSDLSLEAAAMYEAPFEYVKQHVWPVRRSNKEASSRENWWIHQRPRPQMRMALQGLTRFICTPRVAKYRLFVWVKAGVLPANKCFVFARDDDYFLGVLHSRIHEVWSLRMGSWHGVGNDPVYTATTCFETFPLPWPPGQEPIDDPRVQAIGEAARELNQLRENWLNPPDASDAVLKKRTLTNLYNERPTWLVNAHAKLDRAVWAAYGWDDPDPATVGEDTILARLLALNMQRRVNAHERP